MLLNDLKKYSDLACTEINKFSHTVLRTPGGRVGSGMGMLIESLWCYYMNQVLTSAGENCEIAWLSTHQYNDFVCIQKDIEWTQDDLRVGELFRIEVKSMNLEADESKGHFDVIVKELHQNDLILIIIWRWEKIDTRAFAPIISNHFVGSAIELTELRDQLHISRGSSFVSIDNCEEKCDCDKVCKYDGEPLNSSGKRERLSGPNYARPSEKVSHAANFGGLIRMLKTNSPEARTAFREIRRNNTTAHEYISFLYANYPSEEENQYTKEEWTKLAKHYHIDTQMLTKQEIIAAIRLNADYMDILRNI